MAARRRDYRAEYARRIDQGQAKGLSRSQARGHPRAGEGSASHPAAISLYSRQLETGYRGIREGKSLSAAAKDVHVSPERLRRYLRGQGIAERRGRRWVALDDKRPRRMLLYSNGEARTVTVGRPAASDIGTYMSAVGRFLETNNPIYIRPFEDRDVIDLRGLPHPFETNPNTLYRLASSGDDTFEQIYNIGGPQ